MIQYTLICDREHKFDAWFQSAKAFDEQKARGIVTCAICNSPKVDKALMAPAVARSGSDKVALAIGHPEQAQIREAMAALRRKVTESNEYVGERFAEEARKIHFKEVEQRGIYGEASPDEVAALVEDGVDFMPLPSTPKDQN